MEATEISINPSFEIVGFIRLDNDAFIGGSRQVSDNSLDCRGMTLLGVSSETSNLADSEGEIWSGIVA